MRSPHRIRAVVDRLLKDHHIVRPPVPVDKIAMNEGIEVRFQPFDDEHWSGMLYRAGSTAIIAVNVAHPPTRQRFSLAHELGHFFLGSPTSTVFVDTVVVRHRNSTSSLGIDPEEITANQFAAEFLMPRDFLEKDIETLHDDFEWAIAQLAERYQVSEQAMTIRLIKLGYIEPQ